VENPLKTPKAPPAPDPVATAAAQGAANRDTAITQGIMNMTNQVGPDGSLTYSKIGDEQVYDSLSGKLITTPRYQATTTLSAAGQRVNDINNQTEENIATIGRDQSARIGGILGQPIDFSKLGAAPLPTDFSADRQKYEDALMERLNPQISRDRSSLEAKLINQGLRPGSQAYNDAADEMGRNSNDARLGAILNAGSEQSRMFGLASTARQNGIQEILTQRNQPINEITALLNGSQVTQPTFVNTPQTQLAGTDYQGAVYNSYQGQMDAYKQKVATSNAMMGGLFSLASTAGKLAMGSDRRLKTDIQRVGTLDNGLPVYSYRYKAGGPVHIGLMADEVREIHPEAVITTPDGFDAVFYAKAVL
jgi:hypothetical protein